MCHFNILILLFTSAVAVPSRYSEQYDLLGAKVPSDLIAAKSAHTKAHKPAKNLSGKSDQTGYYKTFGKNAAGEAGYEGGTFSNGEKGYKELDTYHKEIKDRYGFEEHFEFGKEEDKKNRGEEKKGAGDSQTAGSGSSTGSSGSEEYNDDGGYGALSAANSDRNEEYSSGGDDGDEYSHSSSYSRNSKDENTSGEAYY